ncbi:hypothetical protein FRC11_009971 [Ceratobasidium sp. 423]|nr:hypothetical protein FRC11_009971 [Ceratobasidium sp. 423]
MADASMATEGDNGRKYDTVMPSSGVESRIECPGPNEAPDHETTGSPQANQPPRTHGFATIEVHPCRVGVLCWEKIDIDPDGSLDFEITFAIRVNGIGPLIIRASRFTFMMKCGVFLLPAGGVAVPVLIMTDPTQLMMHSGDKVACPVYATIGTISKDIQVKPSKHMWVLIGYLPVASLSFIENEDQCQEKKWEIYHVAMTMILEPLKDASKFGVKALCADGGVCMIYLILAIKIADCPEWCTSACSQAT